MITGKVNGSSVYRFDSGCPVPIETILEDHLPREVEYEMWTEDGKIEKGKWTGGFKPIPQ
jgi:hypothetical protein